MKKIIKFLTIILFVCVLIGCETISGMKKDVVNTADNTVDATKVVVAAPVVAGKAVADGTRSTAKAAKKQTMALDRWIHENMW